jgi:hypothetical protein
VPVARRTVLPRCYEPAGPGDERVAVFARGRICAEPRCATVLSTYNPSAYCWVHERRRQIAGRPPARRKHAGTITKVCAYDGCGREFATHNPARVYCSDRCRMAAFQKRRARARLADAGGAMPDARGAA